MSYTVHTYNSMCVYSKGAIIRIFSIFKFSSFFQSFAYELWSASPIVCQTCRPKQKRKEKRIKKLKSNGRVFVHVCGNKNRQYETFCCGADKMRVILLELTFYIDVCSMFRSSARIFRHTLTFAAILFTVPISLLLIYHQFFFVLKCDKWHLNIFTNTICEGISH